MKGIENVSPNLGAVTEGIIRDCEIRLPTEEDPWLSSWIIPKFKTPEEIERLEVPDSAECVKKLERYYFDMGGETYAGIDIERLKYAIEYAKKVGRYPLRIPKR